MSKYYLMCHHVIVLGRSIKDEYLLLEKGIDCKRKPSGNAWTCMYESDTIPEMLHKIQDQKDWRFYTVAGTISSKGSTREEKYPYHIHICSLAGFVPKVCDIRLQPGKSYFDEKWVIDYQAELWIRPGGWGGNEIFKVENFKEHMYRAVQEWIKENNLTYGASEENKEE